MSAPLLIVALVVLVIALLASVIGDARRRRDLDTRLRDVTRDLDALAERLVRR